MTDHALDSNITAGSQQASFTVRHAVIDLMRRFDMTSIFANPGSTELPLFRDFPADFRYVLGLQEATVVGMADGYAQATRNASFVNLHSAAGVGNAMGNIFTAFRNRTPMVITAGQQARSILPFDPFLASVQACELPKPYVKWSIEPARAEDVPQAIARAYYLAMQEPCGPVLVSIPVDDWERGAQPVAPRIVSREIRPDPSVLEIIGTALDVCQRPVFVLGSSVERSGAWDAVVSLAERHNARVFVAPMTGRGVFPEDHRLFAGFLPAIREKIVGLLDGHDLILVIGAPAFTYHIEGQGPHAPAGAALYQLIDDPSIAAWAPTGTAVVGNCRLGITDLLSRPILKVRLSPERRKTCPRVAPTALMTAAFVLQTLSELRNPDDIVVEEAPSARPVMQNYLPFTRSGTFYTMDSGGLGYGMPAAVGVALAKPGSHIIALIGDGSGMYSIQAIYTAVQMKLPITFVIVNNSRYAALQDFASVFGFSASEPVQGTTLRGLDFVVLAAGMGCKGIRVSDAECLHDVLRDALSSNEPMLVDIVIA